MRTALQLSLFCLLFTPFALGVQAKTPPDATTLPQPPATTPTLGPVEIDDVTALGTQCLGD